MRKVKTLLERVKITGKNEERKKAWDYIMKYNFSITEAGPKPIKGRYRQYSGGEFMIIAEREIVDE